MSSFVRRTLFGWLVGPSRLKMNSLRSALTARLASQTKYISGQKENMDMNLPNHKMP